MLTDPEPKKMALKMLRMFSLPKDALMCIDFIRNSNKTDLTIAQDTFWKDVEDIVKTIINSRSYDKNIAYRQK